MTDEQIAILKILEAKIDSIEKQLMDMRSDDMRIVARSRQNKLFHQQLFGVVSRAEIMDMVRIAVEETANKRLDLWHIVNRIEQSTERTISKYIPSVIDRVAIRIAKRFTIAPLDRELKSNEEEP